MQRNHNDENKRLRVKWMYTTWTWTLHFVWHLFKVYCICSLRYKSMRVSNFKKKMDMRNRHLPADRLCTWTVYILNYLKRNPKELQGDTFCRTLWHDLQFSSLNPIISHLYKIHALFLSIQPVVRITL